MASPKAHVSPPLSFLLFINDLIHSLSSLGPLKAQGLPNNLVLWIEGSLRDEEYSSYSMIGFIASRSNGHDFGRFDLVLRSVSASPFAGRRFQWLTNSRRLCMASCYSINPHSKYLGVWFGGHMTWQHHVCKPICKARARLWALHCGIGLGWEVHPLLSSSVGQGGDFTSLILCGTMLHSRFGSGDTFDRVG